MNDIRKFNNEDLVLKVDANYDSSELNLKEWNDFLDVLCVDREYQKDAIRNAIIYLCTGKYKNTSSLMKDNYDNNEKLRAKYSSVNEFLSKLQITEKLFANIDLATGTGKSYVIYGIAQIMLGIGIVDQVLVLCPSLTIEAGLKEKFTFLSTWKELKATLPNSSKIKNPSIIDANNTIKKGDICVENIHAVYENTGSSIKDSLTHKGNRTLVLNDEAHHIFNTNTDKTLKKWKEFLIDEEYGFYYILGFTGTAYIDNEYFVDVIYRYSLKESIENKTVKFIDYVQEDDNNNSIDEKFQKIYANHLFNKNKYVLIKPISILITRDILKAKSLYMDLCEWLAIKEGISENIVQEKVLIVTSHKDHKYNVKELKNVDDKNNSYEWIISVSMLTEGWDVKNVFQIVPWEDRAFNSKLLIAQVLGRGLRIPPEYNNLQPKVIVFNHDSWSKNIRGLVDEVLEIEMRVSSYVIKNEHQDRYKYNFSVNNLNYEKIDKEYKHKEEKLEFDYSKMFSEGIKLESQVITTQQDVTYESISSSGYMIREQGYLIEYNTYSIDEIVDKIYSEFEIRDWEGTVLKLDEDKYTKNELPPREKVENMIKKSMNNVGISGDRLIAKNRDKIFQAFYTLLRKKGKTIIPEIISNALYPINTNEMPTCSCGISNLRTGSTIFYSTNYKNELDEEKASIVSLVDKDESMPKSANVEINIFNFKTPLDIVITRFEPERKFVKKLCDNDIISKYDSWIKSRDMNFYSIEYSLKESTHHRTKSFNPDFFIKLTKDDKIYYLVVEIKNDNDASDENKAKYKYAKEHFEKLNLELLENGINKEYIFHFLSPNGYDTFFEYLKSDKILLSQQNFRCDLENQLEN